MILGLLLQIFGRSYFWRNDGFYITDMSPPPEPRYDYSYYPACSQCSPYTTLSSPYLKRYPDYSNVASEYNDNRNVDKTFNERP